MVQDHILTRYIGIPWLLCGRSLHGTDCLGLALMVQRDLFGRDIPDRWRYDSEDFRAWSLVFPDEMLSLGFTEVREPRHGDVCFIRIGGCGHVATLLWGGHLTITQYTSSTWKPRRMPFRYFRPGEVRSWQ